MSVPPSRRRQRAISPPNSFDRRDNNPIAEPSSFLPVIAAVLAVGAIALMYNMHRKSEIFSFFSVFGGLIALVLIYQTMHAIASLNCYALLALYIGWLARGTMLQVDPSGKSHGFVSNEWLGSTVSLLLIVLALLTLADPRYFSNTGRRVLICAYCALLIIPHTCSMSHTLGQFRLALRTVLFIVSWFAQDFVYARRNKGAFNAAYWINNMPCAEYILNAMRSAWVLFVHESYAIFLLLFLFGWMHETGHLAQPMSPPSPVVVVRDVETGGATQPADATPPTSRHSSPPVQTRALVPRYSPVQRTRDDEMEELVRRVAAQLLAAQQQQPPPPPQQPPSAPDNAQTRPATIAPVSSSPPVLTRSPTAAPRAPIVLGTATGKAPSVMTPSPPLVTPVSKPPPTVPIKQPTVNTTATSAASILAAKPPPTTKTPSSVFAARSPLIGSPKLGVAAPSTLSSKPGEARIPGQGWKPP